jgi:Relaxase/Mobilisation nuclease domain
MIGKVGTSSSARGLLNYCYYEAVLKRKRGKNDDFNFNNVRGEYIYSQNLDILFLEDGRINLDAIIRQFEQVLILNKKCTEPLWHESLSFPIGENPSNLRLTEIIVDFSKFFGFDERQLIAFRHCDKHHHHFHIIANRLDYLGKKAVKTSNNYDKTNQFCRNTEIKYGLIRVENHIKTAIGSKTDVLKGEQANKLKALIDNGLSQSKDINSFKNYLQKKHIKALIGREIVFIDEQSGSIIKGSKLGTEYSFSSIKDRLSGKYLRPFMIELQERNKLKKIISEIIKTTKTEADFRNKMSLHGYSFQIEESKTNNGRVKKEVFFRSNDWINKCLTGSHLGKDFSYEALLSRMNGEVIQSFLTNNYSIHDKKQVSIFDIAQNANTNTEQDLSKIDSNLLKSKNTDSQGIKPKIAENDQKNRQKRRN